MYSLCRLTWVSLESLFNQLSQTKYRIGGKLVVVRSVHTVLNVKKKRFLKSFCFKLYCDRIVSLGLARAFKGKLFTQPISFQTRLSVVVKRFAIKTNVIIILIRVAQPTKLTVTFVQSRATSCLNDILIYSKVQAISAHEERILGKHSLQQRSIENWIDGFGM